jgi:hypothetical protein
VSNIEENVCFPGKWKRAEAGGIFRRTDLLIKKKNLKARIGGKTLCLEETTSERS